MRRDRLGSKAGAAHAAPRFTGEKWQLFGPIIDGHAE